MKNKNNPILEKEPIRESFILYARWYKCISAFSSKSQGLAFKAICEYALFDIPIPKVGFSHLEYTALTSFLPILDSNRKRYENGKKGGVHGIKGGRPQKNKTPEGIYDETPKGVSNVNQEETFEKSPEGIVNEIPEEVLSNTPNGNKNDKENLNKNKNDDDNFLATTTPEYIYNLIMPIFFFRNCDARHELRRFYNHYRLAEWRLTGGDLLDTPSRIKIAAERWKVEDSKPFYPPAFVSIWQDIYEMAPAELKQDIIEIVPTTKMLTSISIICSSKVHKWITSPEIYPRFTWLQQNKTSHVFKIEILTRKENKTIP